MNEINLGKLDKIVPTMEKEFDKRDKLKSKKEEKKILTSIRNYVKILAKESIKDSIVKRKLAKNLNKIPEKSGFVVVDSSLYTKKSLLEKVANYLTKNEVYFRGFKLLLR